MNTSSTPGTVTSSTEALRKTIADRQAATSLRGFVALTRMTLLHRLTNIRTLIFTIGIPVFMYLIFGTNKDYTSLPVAHGNVSAIVLVNLAQFGSATSAATICASIAIEYARGLTRTMALTPLGVRAWMGTRLTTAITLAAIVNAIIFSLGAVLEAQMEPKVWVETYVLATALSIVPALLGLVIGAMVRSEDAYGIIGGGMSLLGFLSGLFIPLNQLSAFFQHFAKAMPLWGINQLLQAPLNGWQMLTWEPIVNIGCWFVGLILLAVVLSKKLTRR